MRSACFRSLAGIALALLLLTAGAAQAGYVATPYPTGDAEVKVANLGWSQWVRAAVGETCTFHALNEEDLDNNVCQGQPPATDEIAI